MKKGYAKHESRDDWEIITLICRVNNIQMKVGFRKKLFRVSHSNIKRTLFRNYHQLSAKCGLGFFTFFHKNWDAKALKSKYKTFFFNFVKIFSGTEKLNYVLTLFYGLWSTLCHTLLMW